MIVLLVTIILMLMIIPTRLHGHHCYAYHNGNLDHHYYGYIMMIMTRLLISGPWQFFVLPRTFHDHRPLLRPKVSNHDHP